MQGEIMTNDDGEQCMPDVENIRAPELRDKRKVPPFDQNNQSGEL